MEELVRLAERGIFQKKSYRDRKEYFKDTAKMLLERGIVSSEFETVIMKREAQYPTGIVTGTIPVSIPHGEFQCVEKESIVITVYKKPVLFSRMDSPEEELEVELPFMLLLKDADSHLNMLKQLSGLLQSPRLPEIRKVDDMAGFLRIIRQVCI